ncbi:MAG: alpha-amylase family glycosyl hydrolase [Verrucomicrobiota bacterium]|nr:alpha-amylase family glycosyl hydrolase [Limisphaera sp.]MDW8382011.1 alpha-amylase family glycosyl hydrolase [Verrucomicrobiota bacterium]
MTPLLLEVNGRCLLRELDTALARPATLAELPEATLDLWQSRGVTHLWLMGLWPTGPIARRIALEHPGLRRQYQAVLPDWQPGDVAGSPYAVAAYEVPERYGGAVALAQFRRRLHARGIRLLLDFVPNHVGLDHLWVRDHPEWFVRSPVPRPGTFPWASGVGAFPEQASPHAWLAHGRDPWFPPWTDTAQLDYRSAGARRAMIETLQRLAGYCDGVRCDMAMLVLERVFEQTWAEWTTPQDATTGEFWAEAIEAVRGTHSDFVFLAEVYWGLETELLNLGFDFVYDKTLYDLLAAGEGPRVQDHLLGLAPAILSRGVHFLENHDEVRAAEVFPPERHRAAAWIAWALPGVRFVHEGQWEGRRARVPVQLQRRPYEAPDPWISRMYDDIQRVMGRAGVGRGLPQVLVPRAAWVGNPTGRNFVLVLWQTEVHRFTLVAVHYAPHPGQCRAPWPAGAAPARRWRVHEHGAGWNDLRNAAMLEREGIYLDLPAWGVQVLEFQRAD